MSKLIRASALIGVFLLTACGSIIAHDEDMAAKKALEFAKLAFISHDAQSSYPLVSDETRGTLPADKFAEVLGKLHPTGYPTTITATQFEPVPGQKSLSIILLGENASEKFFYRLVMVGTAPAGYTVGGLFRSNRAYEGSPQIHGAKLLQPLKAGYTVAEQTPAKSN